MSAAAPSAFPAAGPAAFIVVLAAYPLVAGHVTGVSVSASPQQQRHTHPIELGAS